jgi:hypothetical protein
VVAVSFFQYSTIIDNKIALGSIFIHIFVYDRIFIKDFKH